MKDIVDNRSHIGLSEKLKLALLVFRQNGLRWCCAFAVYYVCSSLAHRAFGLMDRLRVRKGVPGLNSLELNREIWKSWDWSKGGDEWTPSEAWKASVVRRFIDRYFSAGSKVLEIGPGGGRWTGALLSRADAYIGVDISSSCVEVCTKTFAENRNARFVLGNGTDLQAVDSASVDRIWSYDVFVHINEREIGAYLDEFLRVLRPGGVAVIHHGTVGGAAGGWRSNLTAAAMTRLLEARKFAVVESVEEWQDGGTVYDLRAYQDRVTVFSAPQAA